MQYFIIQFIKLLAGHLYNCSRALTLSKNDSSQMTNGGAFSHNFQIYFFQLLKVNFCTNALALFKQVVMDGVFWKLPYCNHNLILMKLWLMEVFEGRGGSSQPTQFAGHFVIIISTFHHK